MATTVPSKVFRTPLLKPETAVAETSSTSFADLVRMMAEGIADAQMALDRSSAEMVTELAETRVDVVPTITETVAADGTVTYEQGKPQNVSLLELGVKPTFYQFSQATVCLRKPPTFVLSASSTEMCRCILVLPPPWCRCPCLCGWTFRVARSAVEPTGANPWQAAPQLAPG